jgi:fructose-bisphosphate aldolase, class II
MPVANYETYCKMLDRARADRFAFPAINVTSLTTANAVLRGLAESKSDEIIQVSTGGGAFASGSSLKDMALGAIAVAEQVHRAAERYPIYVARGHAGSGAPPQSDWRPIPARSYVRQRPRRL